MSQSYQGPVLAYPYVPMQRFSQRYSDDDAIIRGTLFPELDLPFHNLTIQNHLPDTPMTRLMKLDFVCFELKLYLDINPGDANTLELFREYQQKCEEARKEMTAMQEEHLYNNWVYDPWPWELEV